MGALAGLVFSAVAVAAILLVYSSTVYESANGFYSTFGEFFGSLLVILLVGFFINKRRITTHLISICLLVTLGLFCVRSWGVYSDAVDVREAKTLFAQATTPDDILRISKENPRNRMLAMTSELIAVRFEGEKQLEAILAPLSQYEFGCGAKSAERDRQALIRCRDYFVGMATTIDDVQRRYEEVSASITEKLKQSISSAAKRYRFSDPSLIEGIDRGVNTSARNIGPLWKEYVASFAALNRACISWMSFLVDNFDNYDVSNKTILWKRKDLLDRYNALYKEVEKADSMLSQSANKLEAFDKQRIMQLRK